MKKQSLPILETQSFSEYEESVYKKHMENAEKEIVETLNSIFINPAFLVILKLWAGRQGFHFHGWRTIGVRFKSGKKWEINSPVFIKAEPKKRNRGRKPKRRRGVIRHLGLELLGIFDKCSPAFVKLCVHMAVLSPSFEMAALTLRNFGVTINHCLLRNISYRYGNAAMKCRVECHSDEIWRKPGLRIQVCVDAGRSRERRNKKGKRPTGQKRQGFHADWIAPWQFIINVFDENGKIVKSHPPIIDGSCGNIDEFFVLLRRYLDEIDLEGATEVVFCADGGPGIWSRFETLADELNLIKPVFVLDYTHAKQNMAEVTNILIKALRLSGKKAEKYRDEIGNMLWNGDIEGIERIVTRLKEEKKWRRGLSKALKKLRDYFGDHGKFQYATLKSRNIPVGSGAIESAIRRVINLRVKSPGMFWKRENLEMMIFLRSLVLTGKLAKSYDTVTGEPLKMLNNGTLEQLPLAA